MPPTIISPRQANLQKTFTFGIHGTEIGQRINTKIICPYPLQQIIGWKMFCSELIDCEIDILKNGASIVATNPELVSDFFAQSSSLIGWDVDLSENDILWISVLSKNLEDKVIVQLITKIV